jgi:hypothetical protein
MECMGSSLEAVCVGFHAILPLEAVVWFTHDELDLLISELRESSLCKECNATYQVILWFWSVVNGTEHMALRPLLRFVTGSSLVPIVGFHK